jgi:septal ring factor EnvC (AmiA/AmiB activator)
MNQEQLENRIKELEKELQDTKDELKASNDEVKDLRYQMNKLDIDCDRYVEKDEG